MPVAPRRPAALRRQVFRGSAIVAAGALSPRELRSPAWRRLFRHVYACANLAITLEVRAVAAAGLLVPGSVVTGRSAAVLWGVPAAEPDDDVELTVPPGSDVCRVAGPASGVAPRARARHRVAGCPGDDGRGDGRSTSPAPGRRTRPSS